MARTSLEETWRSLESQGEETPRRHDGQCDRRVCTECEEANLVSFSRLATIDNRRKCS